MEVDAEEISEDFYHERQHFQVCLLRCLNNLLQGKKSFSRKELESIADGLSSAVLVSSVPNPLSFVFKPHRNTVTGNYDANVLTSALMEERKRLFGLTTVKESRACYPKLQNMGTDYLA